MEFADLLTLADTSVRKGSIGNAMTYTPGVGAAVQVRGIFDAAYERADVGPSGVASVGPAAWLVLTDLPSDPQTDSGCLVSPAAGPCAGQVFRAHTVEPDGQGTVRLLLNQVS